MVVQEAFALGVPVAASKIGSLPYLITSDENGRLFIPGDAGEILSCVRELLSDEAKLRAMGAGARREFDEKYTSEKNYTTLMAIYSAAAEHRKAGRIDQ